MRRVAAHQYSIADVRLIEDAATKYADHNGKARAIQDVVKNMKEGKNVTVVSVGDSITAGARLRSPQAESYSAVMQKKLREQFRNDRITVSAHAVGGATLIDLLNWMERDIGNTPPDLITILIGTNDKSTGKSCASYAMQFNEYVGRLIAKTQGRSAILLINAVPGKYYRWDMMDDYADAVKEIGNRRGRRSVIFTERCALSAERKSQAFWRICFIRMPPDIRQSARLWRIQSFRLNK